MCQKRKATGRGRAPTYRYTPGASITKWERQKLPCASGFFRKSDTGRVREPTYWYTPGASIAKWERQKLPCASGFFRKNVTGRVREPTYRYTPGASITKREHPKLPCASGFFRKNVTGRVREPTYRYTPGAALIKRRSRGFSWLCWDGAASEWPCSQSGGFVPGSRRKSDLLLPGCGCVHRTYQSASAAHLPLAR